MTPTMHEDFQIGQRVHFDFGNGNLAGDGKIVGISSMHVIFIYIILLDKPLTISGYEGWEAITVQGTLLNKIEDINFSNKESSTKV